MRLSGRLAVALVAVAGAVVILAAHPYPPYWGSGSGSSIHYAPVAWPVEPAWTPYTRNAVEIADRRQGDGSNGGTSPQGYVNVSSGCTDESEPSVYYAFNSASNVLFFRWRVQSPPHNYATGPNAGSFSPTGPWSSALFTVFMDINGDGFRDFGVHLDGSSGGPATAIDKLAAIYSTSRSQSLDYINDPSVKLLAHNPTAFIDGPGLSDRVLNFQNSLNPTGNWPNGSAETVWDYGTTRATLLGTGCGEYFIDYQIPLAMLDASAHGGPTVTANTPMSLFFATANSLNNPIQKDAVVAGDFIADPSRAVPGGDVITPGGGIVVQPTVTAISAGGCGPAALTATVFDTLNNDRTSSVANVTFYSYYDMNGDGFANDAGSSWSPAAVGSATTSPIGRWTATWDSSALIRGQYLVGVSATDAQGNVTWSHLAEAQVNATEGATPPNYANPTGVLSASLNNTCGTAGPTVTKSVSPSSVAAGQDVTFTVAVSNTLSGPLTVSSISDSLPAGFTYQSTSGGSLGAPTTSPSDGASGTIAWTFPDVVVPAASSRALTFVARASTAAGTYTNTVIAQTSYGALTSEPIQVGVGSPQLSIAKTASVSSATPGGTVNYTITYANDSPVNVTNVVITDVVPAGLEFVSASSGSSYDAATRTVTWNLGNLPSGSGAASVGLVTTVTSPYPQGAPVSVVNTATIVSSEAKASASSAPLYVSAPRAVLSVRNDGNVNFVSPGGSVVYTLAYANMGDAPASGVTLADVIPAGWTFVSATGGGVNSAGTVNWKIGALAAGASGSMTVTLVASNPYTGSRPSTNTATLSGTALTSSQDSFTVSVGGGAVACTDYYFRSTTVDVGFAGIAKIANSTPVTASDAGSSVSAQWTSGGAVELVRFYQDPATPVALSFAGKTLTSEIYIDRVNGAGVGITGAVYDYNPADGVTIPIGSSTIGVNGSVKGPMNFSVPEVGSLQAGHRLLWVYSFSNTQNSNPVTLSAMWGGSLNGPITPATIYPAVSRSSICSSSPAVGVVSKKVDKLFATPGMALQYTIVFANAGGTAMTSATVVDTLPEGVTFTSATLNGAPASPTVSGQHLTFVARSSDTATPGQVTPGQAGTIVIQAAVSTPFTGTGSTLINNVSLASSQTSTVSDATVTTLQRPSVTISKSVGDTSLAPGSTVTYALDVLNAGPGAAANVTVTDVLPTSAFFSYLPGSARLNGAVIGPDPVVSGTLSANIGALAAGASARVTFEMVVASSGVPNGNTFVVNTASVSDAQTAGSRTSNSVSVSIDTNPNLSITTTATPAGPVDAGSLITYNVTVGNTGSGDATGVRVSAPLPSAATYTPGSLTYQGSSRTDILDADSASFDGAANRAVFDLGSVPAGASRTVAYTVTVASTLPSGSTVLTSTATATASNASTREASVSVTATAAPVLTLSKLAPASVSFPLTTLYLPASGATTITVADASSLSIGAVVSIDGTVAAISSIAGKSIDLTVPVSGAAGTAVFPTWEYVLDYANTGSAAATSVVVTDVLPANLDVISADNGGHHGAGTVTWKLGSVGAGASGALRVRVRPLSAGSYTNAASIASAEVTTVTSNSTSTSVGSLQVEKITTTPGGSSADGTTIATYVITLTNQSPTTAAENVTITDTLASGFSYVSTVSLEGATAASSPSAGDTQPTWTGLTIAAGSSATLSFVARINNVSPGTYQNEVAVTSTSIMVSAFDPLSTTAEDVTIATELGTSGSITMTPSISPGSPLAITVTDADLDTLPGVVQTMQSPVVNVRTGESETVTLTETGPSTGVFAGTLSTLSAPSAGSNDSASLNVQHGDAIIASYNDLLTADGSAGIVSASSSVINQPPVVVMTLAPLGYTEQDVPAPIDAGLLVSDVDDVNVQGASVAITSNFTAGQDTLAFANQAGITGSYNASTGVLTLTGAATVANYQFALQSVTYSNSSENPVTGARTIAVTVSDGSLSSNTATRSITITAVNDAPVAVVDSYTVAEDGTLSVVLAQGVLANDTDPEANPLSAVLVAGVSNGTLTLNGDGSFTYTPTADFSGTDSFTYKANDGTADSTVATVTITVTTGNDVPTLDVPAAVTVDEDSGAHAVNLTGITAGGGDSQPLTVTAVSANPSLTGAPTIAYATPAGTATLTFTPAPNQFGSTTITVTVADGAATDGSVTRTFDVTVNPVNDAPTLGAIADRSIAVGQTRTVELSGITTGAPNEIQDLVLSVVSSDSSVVSASPTAYTSPAASGGLALQAHAAGTAQITVTVSDGAAVNATTSRTFTVTVNMNTAPTISTVADVSMVEGNTLPSAAFTIADHETPPGALTVTFESENLALLPRAGIVLGGAGAERSAIPTPNAGRIGESWVTVTVSDGELSASTTFRVIVRPRWDYYLLAGRTDGGATTDVRITNPHDMAARVRLTFVKADGTTADRFYDVPALTRQSFRLNDLAEAGSGGVSTFIKSLDDLPLLVERTMVWDGSGFGGASETALESTNSAWFFADGAETATYHSDLVLANPNSEPVVINVRFLLDTGDPVTRSYTLGAVSRQSIALSTVAELRGRTFGMVVTSDLPVAAERIVSFDGPRAGESGAVAAGQAYPSTNWYFAEGSSWRVFNTYVLVANPNAEPAAVTMTYHTSGGQVFQTRHVVGGSARATLDVQGAEPLLEGQHYWMQLTADRPVIAERAMYWDKQQSVFVESHMSRAVLEPAVKWWTGDARVGGPEGFDTYLLIGNTSATEAQLRITYYPDLGAPIVTSTTLAPGGRDTVHVNSAVPQIINDSFWATIETTNSVPIIVERSMYWNAMAAGGWHGGSNVAALPVVPTDYSGCQITVSPGGINAPAQGISQVLSIGATTRCTYVATTNVPWIHVPADASRNGVSTITASIDANASGVARTGEITVAGRTTIVTQRAATVCTTTAPAADWVCLGGDNWVPADHPLASPAPLQGTPGLPAPPPPAAAPATCGTPSPAADWVCVSGGGWVPPDHPLATLSAPVPAPLPVPPPPAAGQCTSPRPADGWVCIGNNAWVPADHPLAGGR